METFKFADTTKMRALRIRTRKLRKRFKPRNAKEEKNEMEYWWWVVDENNRMIARFNSANKAKEFAAQYGGRKNSARYRIIKVPKN